MDFKSEKPETKWKYEAEHDTLIVSLPAEYKKEELKIQVTNTGYLTIRGERKDGEDKFIRFRLTFPIQDYHNANGMTAHFEVGTLSVKFPRLKETVKPPERKQEKPKSDEEVRKNQKEDKGKEVEEGQGVIGEVNRLYVQPGVGARKQVFGGLVTVIKDPRRVMNLALALLLVVVLGIYVKHAFMSMFGETDYIED